MLLVATPALGAAGRDEDEAITVTPAFAYPTGAPGDLVATEVLVQNQTRFDATFAAEVLDAQEDRGDSTALELVKLGSAPRGAGRWTRLDPVRFRLDAGEERRVAVRVAMPDDAGAGGHYAGLRFTASQVAPEGQIDIDPVIEVPVLVTVSGAFERDLRARLAPSERWRWRGGRTVWRLHLRNVGDVHENVSGRIRIDGALSGARSVGVESGILLPGEQRTQRVTFELRDAPDAYIGGATVQLDDTRDVTTTAGRVVVLPWWLLVLLLVAIVVLAWRIQSRRCERREDVEYEAMSDPIDPTG